MDADDIGQVGQHDLVGGPFALIESDPGTYLPPSRLHNCFTSLNLVSTHACSSLGVFTDLARGLGIHHIELVELYDIEPWAVAHLQPRGLIFCHLWHKDKDARRPRALDDPAAEPVWFANQLSDDACASLALLNVMLNCRSCNIGKDLRLFQAQTKEMDPVAVRHMWGNQIARNLQEAAKVSKQPPLKKRKIAPSPPCRRRHRDIPLYRLCHGNIWELDGLMSGPIEVGEHPEAEDGTPAANVNTWMEIVWPALKSASTYSPSSATIIGDQYEKASDEMELLKWEKTVLERRLKQEFPGRPGWKESVDPALLKSAEVVFGSNSGPHPVFAAHFGQMALDRQKAVLDISANQLASAWDACVENAVRANVAVEDEVTKGFTAQKEHIACTFDYEPFIKAFLTELCKDGTLFNRNKNGGLLNKGNARSKR
ncbi:hypothetical protein FA95DRAFT_1613995 [Auriscalpium vulgare]|uniref:Uncharacterized protein n=1 Tax=Auriscalpium vulgare TaxID=40419 RepID=A0ACB8R228_9AGAM|nr:hypothetical protein FA95DRAFT_1613995 [Auriscalpium vulgare]